MEIKTSYKSLLGESDRTYILNKFIASVPYITYLGIRFFTLERSIIATLPFRENFLGNQSLRALHGGVTASFLEITAAVCLCFRTDQNLCRVSKSDSDGLDNKLPKTIDFSIDYLRAGEAIDAFCIAKVNRIGRRYASLNVEAWQADPDKPFAQATGHFLMPVK